MPKCKHERITASVNIDRKISAEVGELDVLSIGEIPVGLRIEVSCQQCPYVAVFTAAPNREDGYGWRRWPKWLIRRMGVLSRESPAVHEALEEFEFSTVPYA